MRTLTKKKKGNRKIMKKTGKLLVLLMMMFTASIAFGATVKVNAVVDRDQMGIGDSFTLNISVQSDEDFELVEPELPKVPGLEVINAVPGGRQSSSSMTIINGKTQFIQRTSQDFNFVLSPQKEGVFVIPAIDVKIKGQSYRTNPVKVEVSVRCRTVAGPDNLFWARTRQVRLHRLQSTRT